PSNKPTELWEIKLAWSELRNGKWLPKQLSSAAVYATPAPGTAPPEIINAFKFVPRSLTDADGVTVDVSYAGTRSGAYRFTGNQLTGTATLSGLPDVTLVDFHSIGSEIHSMQPTTSGPLGLFHSEPYFVDDAVDVTAHAANVPVNFYHPF